MPRKRKNPELGTTPEFGAIDPSTYLHDAVPMQLASAALGISRSGLYTAISPQKHPKNQENNEGVESSSALEQLTNPEDLLRINQTREAFAIVAKQIVFPTNEQLANSDFNWERLKKAPPGELVLDPSLSPEEIKSAMSKLRQWQDKQVKSGVTIPDSQRLEKHDDGDALYIWNSAKSILNSPNLNQAVDPGPNQSKINQLEINGRIWRIMKVPTKEVTELGTTNRTHSSSTNHITLSAYTAAQITHFFHSETPIDYKGWSWIAENDCSHALRVGFYPGYGQLYVSVSGVDDSGPDLGVRPPVWGQVGVWD